MKTKNIIYISSTDDKINFERIETILLIASRTSPSNNWDSLSFKPFEFTESNYEILRRLINVSYTEIQNNLTDEPMGVEKVKGNLENNLYSKFNKFMYGEGDLFEFFCDLFIGYLGGHYLTNGNKRFSICFLKNVLNVFGYSFYNYDSFFEKNEKFNVHTILSNFVTKISAKSDTISFEINKWLKENIIIG